MVPSSHRAKRAFSNTGVIVPVGVGVGVGVRVGQGGHNPSLQVSCWVKDVPSELKISPVGSYGNTSAQPLKSGPEI